jgi:hypothetical protein
MRYLGVTISCDLSWERQVSQVVTRVHWGLKRLRGMQFRPGRGLRLTLVKVLLFSIIDYGLIPCSDLSGGDVTRLQTAQNACLRYVFRPGITDHMTPYFAREGILRVKDRRTFNILSSGHKIWTSHLPSYIYLGMTLMRHVHGLGTRNALILFQIPFHRSARMAASFVGTFARAFNALPAELRANFSSARLHKHLVTQMRGDRAF